MLQIDKYTALELDEYAGKDGTIFSLIEGWVGREGDFKKNWITEEIGQAKEKKNMPKRVKIGDKAKAIEVCCWLLMELTGKQYVPMDNFTGATQPPDDDVPF